MGRWTKWLAASGLIVASLAFRFALYYTTGLDMRLRGALAAVVIAALLLDSLTAMFVAIVGAALIQFLSLDGTISTGLTDRTELLDLLVFGFIAWILTTLIHRVKEQILRFSIRQSQPMLWSAIANLCGPMTIVEPRYGESGEIAAFEVEQIHTPEGITTEQSLGHRLRPGESLEQAFSQGQSSELHSRLCHVLKTGQAVRMELGIPAPGEVEEQVLELRIALVDQKLLLSWRDRTTDRAVQQKLRVNEWRYRSLIQATTAIIWNTPPSGEFESEQPEWSAFTGQTFEESRGWGWLKAVHPDDRDRTAMAWSTALARRTLYQVEYRLRHSDGGYRDMSVRAVPIFSDAGELLEWLGVHSDITDRRQAERMIADSERHLRRVLNSLFAFVGVLTPDGTLISTNDAPLKAAGIEAEDVLGKKYWDCYWWCYEPLVQEQLRDAVTKAAQGISSRYDVEIQVANGKRMPIDFMIVPMRDTNGQITHLIPSAVDISDRKRTEEALRRSESGLISINNTLEKRVRERTAEAEGRSEQLRAMALDLAETESRERKRLAQLLHDGFQQLVSAAKLKAAILRRRGEGQLDLDAVRQIEALLDEAITASRTLATELSPPVLHDGGLGPALEWLVRRTERDHGLHVAFELHEPCEPGNEQVRTIVFECVRELLFNIRKHAGVDQANMLVELMPEGLLHIRIADQGKGFEVGKEERRKRNDGAFGLFSVRERLGLIGGLMNISSRPGYGTTVDLTVPCVQSHCRPKAQQPELPVHPPPAIHGTDTQRLRVLVADDHKLFREGLVAILAQEPGIEVIGQATDGVEATDMSRQLRPDILILDVSMPRMNGIQVANIVSRELPGTRIIGLSMHEHEDMAQAMRDAGAIAYCPKSGSADETLLTVLRSVAKPVESMSPS